MSFAVDCTTHRERIRASIHLLLFVNKLAISGDGYEHSYYYMVVREGVGVGVGGLG